MSRGEIYKPKTPKKLRLQAIITEPDYLIEDILKWQKERGVMLSTLVKMAVVDFLYHRKGAA